MKCEVVKMNLQFHQDAAIFSVAAVPEGSSFLVATAGGDGAVRLWRYTPVLETSLAGFKYCLISESPSTMDHLATLAKHTGSATCARFSADGALLVTAGDSGAVFLWDVKLVLSANLSADDFVYPGQPTVVREPDGADIYDLQWLNRTVLLGTSKGRVEIYAIEEKQAASTKAPPPAGANPPASSGAKFRVISALDTPYKAKCILSRKAHKDIVQGVAGTDGAYASFGNDRTVKVFSTDGRLLKKMNKKSLISDRHTLFFRRLAFSPEHTLYLPSGCHNGKYTLHVLTGPAYALTSTIGPFNSSVGNVCPTERLLLAAEGCNLYVFARGETHTLLGRVLDCSFLPITDIQVLQETPAYLSALVAAADGFITNLVVYL